VRGMSGLDFQAQGKAYVAFGTWLAQGDEIIRLFQQAGLALPSQLSRLRGGDLGSAKDTIYTLPPLPSPPRPPESSEDWIHVAPGEATIANLIRALLRINGNEPLQPPEIHRALTAVVPDIGISQLYKVGYKTEWFVKGESGWALVDPHGAPVLFSGYVWGPPSAFNSQEMASYRRPFVCHVLRHYPGLVQTQMVQALEQFADFKGTISKDGASGDFVALEAADVIVQDLTTRGWSLIEQEEKKQSAA
jgi:hypothetical protein